MSDRIPVAVWSGEFRLFGVAIKCHVLDDGRRVVDVGSLNAFFAAMHAGEGTSVDDTDLDAFARWLRGMP